MSDWIALNDRGLLLGDGLFETILALNGTLQDPLAHLARMHRGCVALGLPAPDNALALDLMRTAIEGAGLHTGRAAVRLTLTAGSGGRGLVRPAEPRPCLFATAVASARPLTPARLALASIRRNPTSPTTHHKTLAYLDNVLARREALDQGADEAVMLNTSGHLACAAAANLFWIEGETLITPDLPCGVLPGLMRAKVIAAAAQLAIAVQTVTAGPERLDTASLIFLTNSLNGIWPVCVWQTRALSPSPEAARIMQALDAQLSSGA